MQSLLQYLIFLEGNTETSYGTLSGFITPGERLVFLFLSPHTSTQTIIKVYQAK